jgi:TatD DNase family protein
MPSNPYIDFHTHQKASPDENVISIYSHFELEEDPLVSAPHFFCAGAHPWFLPEDIEKLFERLAYLSKKERFIAIGEIGLDRLKGGEIQTQMFFLKSQIDFALSVDSPAIIFHCVRSFDLFFQVLKNTKYQGALVFHDYNGNEQITDTLLENPSVYFSLGSMVMRQNQGQLLKRIPKERIFFETDDHPYSVKTIYHTYSKLTGTPVEVLKEQIISNFNLIFSKFQINILGK